MQAFGLSNEFADEAKNWFTEGVISAFREPLMRSIVGWDDSAETDEERAKEFLKQRLFEIGRKIDASQASIYRWLNESGRRFSSSQMNWEHIFVAIAALGLDVNGRVPTGRDAAVDAIAIALERIQGTISRNADWKKPSRIEIGFLHYAIFDPNWSDAIQCYRGVRYGNAHHKTAKRVFKRVKRVYPGAAPRDFREILCLVDRWADAWIIFHAMVGFHWSFMGEEDVS